MPTLKNSELQTVLIALTTLMHGPIEGEKDGQAIRGKPLKFSAMSGLRFSSLHREILPRYRDVNESKARAVTNHVRHVEGKPVSEGGNWTFDSDEAEEAYLLELAELLDGTIEVAETLSLRDFIRKERDDSGKVYEVDDIDGWIMEALRPLIILNPTG